jgi:hypothetical protein
MADELAMAALLVLVAVFALGLYAHVVYPSSVRKTIRELALPGSISRWLVVAEAAVLTVLLSAPATGGVLSLGFLIAATAPFALRGLRRRPLPSDCGCFGPLSRSISSVFYLRNLVFAGAAGLLVFAGPVGIGPSGVPLGLAVGAAVLLIERRWRGGDLRQR